MHDRVFKHTSAHKLEDPQRLQWLPPSQVLSLLGLLPGMRVADIGAGTGYFSIPIARTVGRSGHVFAVDLQAEMLDMLRKKLESADAPQNISLHAGNATLLPLPGNSVDIVFYANIWHEIEDLESTFREASRISIPGGKIAILDWRDDCVPPPGPPQAHRIPVDSVVSLLNGKACEHVLSTHVGEFNYLVSAQLKP
jgi:ubiquinone/menaquinone biosynthesis C-methylase UbiE